MRQATGLSAQPVGVYAQLLKPLCVAPEESPSIQVAKGGSQAWGHPAAVLEKLPVIQILGVCFPTLESPRNQGKLEPFPRWSLAVGSEVRGIIANSRR